MRQISPLVVALRYRERWIVEDIFRTREIHHQIHGRSFTSVMIRVRGHVFLLIPCSAAAQGTHRPSRRRRWASVRNGPISFAISISSFKPTSIRVAEGFAFAPPRPGCCGAVFQAVGVALPPDDPDHCSTAASLGCPAV